MHEKYVEPTKKKAAIIVSGNMDNNDFGFSLLIEKVRNILDKN